MTKYFCDNCGRELRVGEEHRLKGEQGKIAFEIMTATSTTTGAIWNTGHYCHDCIRAAVAATAPGEKRLKQTSFGQWEKMEPVDYDDEFTKEIDAAQPDALKPSLSEIVQWFAGEIDREWQARTTWRSTPDVLCALDKALGNLKDKDSGAARRIAVYAMRIADNYRTGHHGTETEPPKPAPSLPHVWNMITGGYCLYCGANSNSGNYADQCPSRSLRKAGEG